MSDRNKHDYITFGWIATIVFVLLSGSLYNSQYTRPPISAEYTVKCAEQYKLAAANSDNLPNNHKIAKQNRNFERQINWCDLAAQQSMAESTRGVHWAAWFTVIFTCLGAYLLWQTLLSTQDVVAETRRIGEAQTRAYLTIDDGVVFPNQSQTFLSYKLKLKNTGSSPAKDIIISKIFTVHRKYVPIINPFHEVNNNNYIFGTSLFMAISSGENVIIPISFEDLDDDVDDMIEENEIGLFMLDVWLFGYDVFGNPIETQYMGSGMRSPFETPLEIHPWDESNPKRLRIDYSDNRTYNARRAIHLSKIQRHIKQMHAKYIKQH